MRRSTIAGLVLVVLLAGGLLPGSAGAAPTPQDAPGATATVDDSPAQTTYADADGGEGEYEEDGGEEDEDEESGGQIIGDWWGLGEEAQEAPYMGLVELGVVMLSLGLIGYSVGKRTSLVPLSYRKRLLQGHEWTMLAGTALVAPHFFAVEEWEGLGLVVGVLLAVEVLSGFYGRHLHRRVIRLGRGDDSPPILGRFVEVTMQTVLVRWRRVHVLLTVVTAVVLVLHIVTAIGD